MISSICTFCSFLSFFGSCIPTPLLLHWVEWDVSVYLHKIMLHNRICTYISCDLLEFDILLPYFIRINVTITPNFLICTYLIIATKPDINLPLYIYKRPHCTASVYIYELTLNLNACTTLEVFTHCFARIALHWWRDTEWMYIVLRNNHNLFGY